MLEESLADIGTNIYICFSKTVVESAGNEARSRAVPFWRRSLHKASHSHTSASCRTHFCSIIFK